MKKENKELTQHQKLFDKQLHKSYEKGRAEAVKGITQTDREVEALKTQIASLQADNEALTNSIDMPFLRQSNSGPSGCVARYDKLHDRHREAQKRCVNVVIEMKQNKQELIDRVNSAEKELKKSQSLNDKYHAEVLKAQGFNGDLKDKLASYKERIAHLEKSNNNSSKIASKENLWKKASGTPGRTAKEQQRSLQEHRASQHSPVARSCREFVTCGRDVKNGQCRQLLLSPITIQILFLDGHLVEDLLVFASSWPKAILSTSWGTPLC